MGVVRDPTVPVEGRGADPGDGGSDDSRSIPELIEALMGVTGEISGVALATRILHRYEALDDAGKVDFFRHLEQALDIDPEAVRDAVARWESERSRAAYSGYMAVTEPSRQELFRRLNQPAGATGRLVSMRADLLRLRHERDQFASLDHDMQHLFSSWFNRGFLTLDRISWDTPASTLEKLIRYEAVHDIDGWTDLRRRVDPSDRRCFAFFHPAMPGEPLIFVVVALTQGAPGSVQHLLAEDRQELAAEAADTAVFYSISNCQPGLAGISFGNLLIKQVARDLAAELPGLRSFITLSPLPKLRDWADSVGVDVPDDDSDAMRRLAVRYLTTAKRGDGRPFDPVARFHLGNGALIDAVHADADTSTKGRRQSGGAMVTYRYDLAAVPTYHERYVTGNEIAVSAAIGSLSFARSSP